MKGRLSLPLLLILAFSQETLGQVPHRDRNQNVVESQVFRRGHRTRARGNERSAAPRFAGVTSPVYSGTGCPAGSAGISLSPDNKTLSILFDCRSWRRFAFRQRAEEL